MSPNQLGIGRHHLHRDPAQIFGRVLATLLVVLVVLLGKAQNAQAQSSVLEWSDPERVWGYEDVAEPPFMVADRNNIVHAMNSRTTMDSAYGGIDITYRRWNASQGWTEPIDVLLSPKKNMARIRGLVMDDADVLHVTFYGGDEQDAAIYYTKAPALNSRSCTFLVDADNDCRSRRTFE